MDEWLPQSDSSLVRRQKAAAARSRLPRQGTPALPESFSEQPSSSLFLDYLRTIGRYRWLIAFSAVLGLVLSVLWNVNAVPVYQARTSIDIQSLNSDFMNMKSVAPTSDEGTTSNDSYVQTQIKLLQSDTLLENTAARLKAEQHSAFIVRNDLVSRFKRTLHITSGTEIPYGDLVDYTALHVKAKPLGLTRLIELTCDSWSAEFSAKFCNTLTTEFQVEDQRSRGSEARKTSEWLAQQAEDVRLKAQELEKNLEVAVGGNGLILSQESNSVGEDRLRDVQQELVRAQAERMEREAQAAVASSSSADTVPGVVDRPAYQAYQQKLADLRAQVAQLVPPLTEENPKVIHLRSQIREVEAGLAIERGADTDRMRNEYEAARHREALLRATYEATAAGVSSDLGKASRVRLLRGEVESEQHLYETLLQHAKEAGFASAMHASTLHIVDAARIPRLPITPRRGSAALVGVLLGTFAGLGLAFFKDRNFEVLRLPGDASRHLHLHELGVIPSATESTLTGISAARKLTSAMGLGMAANPPSDALSLAKWEDNFSLVAEAYRSATLSIMLSEAASKTSRIYVVASPSSNDGKTSVTSNLGVALSKSRLRVLVVDGDLRRPTLHTALGVPNKVGLRNALSSQAPLSSLHTGEFCVQTSIPNLWVLPSGSGTSSALDLLHTTRLRQLLNKLAESFDVILIDTPPMLHMADARLFAGHTDGVILVVRSGVTMREDAVNAIELFARDGVHIVGTILNDFDPAKQGLRSYYKSYYGYRDHHVEAEEVGIR